MHVAAIRIDLHFPLPHSLKEKRALLKPIIEGARNKFNVAVAEVDFQDQWQRCAIGVSAVSSSPGHVDDILEQVERYVWSFPNVDVLDINKSWMDSTDLSK